MEEQGSAKPLDGADPRFVGEARRVPHRRAFVRSKGPGPSLEDPRVRLLGLLIRAVFIGAIVVAVVGLLVGLGTRPAVGAPVFLVTEAALPLDGVLLGLF